MGGVGIRATDGGGDADKLEDGMIIIGMIWRRYGSKIKLWQFCWKRLEHSPASRLQHIGQA